MKIPKLIHQTWKNEIVPEQFKAFAHTWKEKHPQYDYILWTDKMNRDFIKKHFPAFIKKYDSYPANIQRVDAVRYFVLYKMGGIYIDLDFECLKNIEALLEDQFCVFGKEPDEHSKIHHKKLIISNAFMAATPKNHFLEIICRQLYIPDKKPAHPFNDILESTGPFMLTRVYQDYPFKKTLKYWMTHLYTL